MSRFGYYVGQIKFKIINSEWKKIGMISGSLIILVLIGVIILNKYIIQPKKINNNYVMNDEYIEKGRKGLAKDSPAKLYLFYLTWCPDCHFAIKQWDALQGYLALLFDSSLIHLEKIECEERPEMCERFNIEHYPKVKMVKHGKTIDFEGIITKESLEEFIRLENPEMVIKKE